MLALRVGSKVPGTAMEVRDVTMDFAYGEAVVVLPDLLPRATTGGSTLDEIFSKYITALGGQVVPGQGCGDVVSAIRLAHQREVTVVLLEYGVQKKPTT